MFDWKIFAVGSAFFAGLTAVWAKVGVKDIPSDFATLIRTFIIFIFLSLWVSLRSEWENPFALSRKGLIFLTLSALTAGFSWLCYFRALQTGPVSLVSSIDKLGLVFAVLFSVWFLAERLSGLAWMGVFLMTLGALLIAIK